MKDICKDKWILCGDFNSTRRQEERRGKNWSSRVTDLFNSLIQDLAIIDLPMNNQSFTWSNMQRNPTMARLDRFLVSTEWDQEFPLTKVESLPRVTSDHFPILLSSESNVPRTRKIFRFEDVWLTHEDLVSKLPSWWQEEREEKTAMLLFTAKLRHC